MKPDTLPIPSPDEMIDYLCKHPELQVRAGNWIMPIQETLAKDACIVCPLTLAYVMKTRPENPMPYLRYVNLHDHIQNVEDMFDMNTHKFVAEFDAGWHHRAIQSPMKGFFRDTIGVTPYLDVFYKRD